MKQTKKRTRRKFNAEFKAKVALEALKSQETVNQIAARFELHPHQVAQWKKQLLEQASSAFDGESGSVASAGSSNEAELYEQIGRLKMELEWLKKKLGGLAA
jgi:putative transposase